MSYLTLSYLACILVQCTIFFGPSEACGLLCAPGTGWSLPQLSFRCGSALFHFFKSALNLSLCCRAPACLVSPQTAVWACALEACASRRGAVPSGSMSCPLLLGLCLTGRKLPFCLCSPWTTPYLVNWANNRYLPSQYPRQLCADGGKKTPALVLFYFHFDILILFIHVQVTFTIFLSSPPLGNNGNS